MAEVVGNLPVGRQHLLHHRRMQKVLHQGLVNVLSEQAQGGELAFGDERGEFQAGNVEQEDMHGIAEITLDDVTPETEFADVGLARPGRVILQAG